MSAQGHGALLHVLHMFTIFQSSLTVLDVFYNVCARNIFYFDIEIRVSTCPRHFDSVIATVHKKVTDKYRTFFTRFIRYRKSLDVHLTECYVLV